MEDKNLGIVLEQTEAERKSLRGERIRSAIVWTIFFGVMASFIISALYYDKARIQEDQAALKQNVEAKLQQWEGDVADLRSALDNGEAPKGDMTRAEYEEGLSKLSALVEQGQSFTDRIDKADDGYRWYNQKSQLESDWNNIAIEFDTLRAQLMT